MPRVPNFKCDYFKIAQGWELHTHPDIIRKVVYINNQQKKNFIR